MTDFGRVVAYLGLVVYPLASFGFVLLAHSGMTTRSGAPIKRTLSYLLAAFYFGSTFLPFIDLFDGFDKALVQLAVRAVTIIIIGVQWIILWRERHTVLALVFTEE